MSYTLQIHAKINLVVVVFEGEVSIDELVELDEHLTHHPDYQIHYNGVYDFRNSKKTFKPSDLIKLKNKSPKPIPEKGRWCSINETPVETGLSELFRMKRIKVHHYEVFSTVEAASAYLHIDLNQFLPEQQ